jgi:hypothetical protein
MRPAESGTLNFLYLVISSGYSDIALQQAQCNATPETLDQNSGWTGPGVHATLH